jgi:hypothetical protein
MKPVPGPDGANQLVASYGRHLGVSDARLDEQLDRSFGECGFHYDPQRDVLLGRVYVNRARIKSASPKGQKNYRDFVHALNDPAIGGMFERGGATFVLDEEKEILFLVREFPVGSTSAGQLRSDMDEIRDVSATWTTRWIRRVARILDDEEPRPTAPVTRHNDPR